MLNYGVMNRPFPIHGVIGIAVLILSEILHLRQVEPFYSWFYCFAWWSYILAIDGVIYWLKGNSLILSRTKEFFLMIPWSTLIWLIFEAANLSLKNWYYINLPDSTVERWLGYAVAYGTVLPGIFETTELLDLLGLFKTSEPRGSLSLLPPAGASWSSWSPLSCGLHRASKVFLLSDLGWIHLPLGTLQRPVWR